MSVSWAAVAAVVAIIILVVLLLGDGSVVHSAGLSDGGLQRLAGWSWNGQQVPA